MSKSHAVPKSFFRIEIDPSNPEVYVAGDIVSGKVVLQSKIDQSVGKVTVQFSGRQSSELYMSNGRNIADKRDLFDETLTLYSSHYTLRANIPYEWPFRFSFPESSTGIKSQPLLPTFQSYRQRIHRGTGHSMTVSYLLSAVLSRPMGASQQTGYNTEWPIKYFGLTLPGNESHSDPSIIMTETLKMQNSQLESENPDRPLPMGQKMWFIFKPLRIPSSFSFELNFGLHGEVRIGEAKEGFLRLKRASNAACEQNLPTVSLKSLETQIKATSTMKHLDSTSTRETISEFIQNNKYSRRPDPFTEEEDFCKTFPIVLNYSQDHVPSFEVNPSHFGAPAFKHQYSLKVKCEVVCAGKTLKAKAEHNLTVLPGARTQALPQSDTDPLPSYEEAPSYNEAAAPLSDDNRNARNVTA